MTIEELVMALATEGTGRTYTIESRTTYHCTRERLATSGFSTITGVEQYSEHLVWVDGVRAGQEKQAIARLYLDVDGEITSCVPTREAMWSDVAPLASLIGVAVAGLRAPLPTDDVAQPVTTGEPS